MRIIFHLFAAAFILTGVGASDTAAVVIDNGAAGTSFTGKWGVSGAAGYYGTNSVWARDGATYTWSFTPSSSGAYEMSMWWTEYSSRASNIPVDIRHAGGTARVHINQQQNGGKWNLLGTYSFNAGTVYTVTIIAQPAPSSTCADAVMFSPSSGGVNAPPTAVIDSISPNPAAAGQTVSFSGHGTDSDGTIAGYSWRSGLDGALSTAASFTSSSLSAGTHTIYFRVQDDKGEWSPDVSRSLTIAAASSEAIIDNSMAGTSSTGTWAVSGASGFYGTNSLWSRDGATYTWSFTPGSTGSYDVSMWWTNYYSRSTSIPVDITHAGGTTRVMINQQQDGGKWNSLGVYSLTAGQPCRVTITSQPGPTSTCADAVRFIAGAEGNVPPLAVIDSITPNPVQQGQVVTFTGHGADTDGSISAYSWRSSIDGALSTAAIFTTNSLSPGSHVISLQVRDDDGAWSPSATRTLQVEGQNSAAEHIYFVVMYNAARSWVVAVIEGSGARQDGDVWRYTNPNSGKNFTIHIVEDLEGMRQALYTQDSHIIINGHANYGSGGIFATPQETSTNIITNFYYIDDPRMVTYSSPWAPISVSGMITGQSYPNWRPIFQDGTSGIMPSWWGDPNGDPPYNYYHTYRVAGDQTYYRVETVHNSALQRFPDWGGPAWYSATGAAPDPSNPGHLQYYVTNPDRSFDSDGTWLRTSDVAGYYGGNYCAAPAGQGRYPARWNFEIPEAGTYSVFAWWPASSGMVANARYTVRHASGETAVTVDQRSRGGAWNRLGDFSFSAGSYSITLTDAASAGTVAADAVRVTHRDNPAVLDRIVDNLRCPRTHYGSKTVIFRKDLDIDINRFAYRRILVDTCSSGIYYLDTFHRGLMFLTVNSSNNSGTYQYLKNYLEGKSDAEIWAAMQASQPVYDYYDFTKRPSEQ